MTLSTEFFRLRDSPEGSSSRRLIIIGAVGVACLLLFIHHIRLEVAARPSSSEVAARNSSSEEATVKRLKYLESRYEALAKSLGWSKLYSVVNSQIWFDSDWKFCCCRELWWSVSHENHKYNGPCVRSASQWLAPWMCLDHCLKGAFRSPSSKDGSRWPLPF